MKKNLIKLIGIMIAIIVVLSSCSDSTEETDPCQIELPNRKPGEHWSSMEMVVFGE